MYGISTNQLRNFQNNVILYLGRKTARTTITTTTTTTTTEEIIV